MKGQSPGTEDSTGGPKNAAASTGLAQARALFRTTFDAEPRQRISVGGRIEILGNHTDYNEGLVLAAAIDRRLHLVWSRCDDPQIELVSTAFPGLVSFSRRALDHSRSGHWSDYVKAILRELPADGGGSPGFRAAVHSDIPVGGGLSSSAALLLAIAVGIGGRLFATTAEKLAVARLCQQAENNFMGVRCGLLDYLAILHGVRDRLVALDFRTLEASLISLPTDLLFALADSGVRHRLIDGGYNAIRGGCEGAAATLGLKSLRDLTEERLRAGAAALSIREYKCARHVLDENGRVRRAIEAMHHPHAAGILGRLMSESHVSSRNNLGNSCRELDLLVELGDGLPGSMGGRLTGGGFGGMVLYFLRANEIGTFQTELVSRWQKHGEGTLQSMAVRPVDGVECDARGG